LAKALGKYHVELGFLAMGVVAARNDFCGILAQLHRRLRSRLSLPRCQGFCLIVLLLGTSVLCTTFKVDAADRRQVLIIYSWNDLLPWQAGVRDGMQQALEQTSAADRPNIYEERLDAARISGPIAEDALDRYLREKYASVRFNTIIAESANATTFLLHRPGLFAEAARFSVNATDRVSEGRNSRDRAFATYDDVGRAMSTIIQVLPETDRIVAIVDTSTFLISNLPQHAA
jgi:hypothetical protein